MHAAAPLQWQGTLTGQDLLLLVILGVVFTALGQGLVVASLQQLRAQTASVIFGLEPVYGILLAWLLLGEIPAPRTLVGGVLICGAVLWASVQHGKSTDSPAGESTVLSEGGGGV